MRHAQLSSNSAPGRVANSFQAVRMIQKNLDDQSVGSPSRQNLPESQSVFPVTRYAR